MAAQKELQTPLICRNEKKTEDNQPFIDFRDMTMILSIICSALITYVFIQSGLIIWERIEQLVIVCVSLIFSIALVINWICNKIVYLGKKKSLSQTVKSNDREKAHCKCNSVSNIAQNKEENKSGTNM